MTSVLQPVPPRRHSLSHRLVAATLLISALISASVIVFEMMRAYGAARASAEQRLDEIGTSIVPSLSDSLWQVDFDRVELLLDGIARLPGVAYVNFVSREGERRTRGEDTAVPLLQRSYPLRYAAKGMQYDLGSLDIVIGKQQVLEQLRNQGAAIALVTTISLASSALLLLLLFRRWVTRHLVTMADYARALNIRKLDMPLVLAGKLPGALDELDQMALSFNRMRESLARELAVRDQHEAELELHREHLELLVNTRTAQLEEKTAELQKQKDEMQRIANTDGLTGVESRRHFTQLAERELARCRRSLEPLSLLLLDVDHFKRINDRHGHAAGDAVLKALCRICRLQLREVDIIGRLGGEEFAMLLPGSQTADARRVAERIRAALAASRIDTPEGALAFTVSIGVASLHDNAQDLDTLLSAADTALYSAKDSGRDRVCLYAQAQA